MMAHGEGNRERVDNNKVDTCVEMILGAPYNGLSLSSVSQSAIASTLKMLSPVTFPKMVCRPFNHSHESNVICKDGIGIEAYGY